MRETAEDVAWLQDLLDRSAAVAGPHLRSAFDQSRRLAAEEFVDRLAGGIIEAHVAVLGGAGQPLVAPLDTILYRVKLWISVPGAALRSRLLRRDGRVSVSYNADDLAFIAHGVAVESRPGDLLDGYRSLMKSLYANRYGPGWIDWYEAEQRKSEDPDFVGYVEPRVMFTKGCSEG